jgi:transcriptional regulator of acetoin/glycerol metabolism
MIPFRPRRRPLSWPPVIPRPRKTGTESMRISDVQRPSDAPRAGLVLLYAPSFVRLPTVLPFDRDELLLGSAPPAHFVLGERAISGRHALVRRTEQGYSIVDQDSRNGVLVNGQFVSEALLEHLDEVRLGDALFKYVDREIDAYRPMRVDGAMMGEDPDDYAARVRCPVVGGVMVQRLVRQIEDVAPTGLKVLLLGETGTGKEVFAEYLHARSRRTGEFVAVNCAAIAPSLAEAELFGVRRGAHSAAVRDAPGFIRQAHGGTLFLDEIGELSLDLQAKLLRVLQRPEVTPVGAAAPEPVDVRFVAATHRDLRVMEEAGLFRRDLRARLGDFPLLIPALRDRKEDLYQLTRALLARHGAGHLSLDMPAWTALLFHDYPGNVRELEAALRRAALLATAAGRAVVGLGDLPEELRESMAAHERPGERVPPTQSSPGVVPPESVTPERLRELLVSYRGNLSEVARALGKPRATVRRWIVRAGLDIEASRQSARGNGAALP